ncbi:MAG: ribosome-associated translation inhibitor RaiA, partial [Lachnospiraceae bacterium]|nr:ribosome-associated translation inhibitor RaiA [Lachnospiraceae bacterium]
MNYIISGKNIDVTEGLKTAIYDKLGRLEKFFTDDTDAQVTLSVEKERQKIEVTIPMKGHIIRAEQASDDMYVSIDLVVEVIERQVTRYKKKIVDKEQNANYIKNDFFSDEDTDDE